MTSISNFRPKALSSAKALLLTASTLAMSSVPAQAADVLFSSTGVTDVATGARTSTGSGVLQLRLDNGATLSFVEGAEFTLNEDGSVTLHKGSVTVAGAGDAQTRVIMPEGVEGVVGGTGNAASFSVGENGASSGHTLTGTANISRRNRDRDFGEGMMWASSGRTGIRRVMTRGEQPTPDAAPEVLDMAEGGPPAAAENGLPVSLGDALAAAGASSDVITQARRIDAANGNPVLETYPTGDLAALVALAANLEGAYGGRPFPAAQADIIRTYLGYLANGGSGAEFVTAYAGFLTQYLDLVRAGGLPSQFGGASQTDINAFLAYQANLGALGNLGAQNRALAQAYLEFITGGGNADLFTAQFTDLVEAYFAFVRGGGNPGDFTGASQEVVDAYVTFLAESGLAAQLSAENQEILAAYLESGGFAFAETYAAALADYFAYLQAGGLPSASGDLSPQQLQAYLELLEGSGLFAQLLGEQSQFYADYLAFLQGGGDADAFGQLNANIFAGYAGQLNAYYAFLLGGGLPSNFTGDPEVLAAYLAALDNAGALDLFLGANAGFFADYLAFLQGGGNADAFGQLNANIFAGYADALSAYYTYLAQGGLPSQYGALTQDQIAAYVAALQAQGASSAFLAALSGFYSDYLAYLHGGGNPDVYLGLPSLNTQLFADALDAFGQFLLSGGLPSDFSASDLDTLALYIDALNRAGQLGLIGSDADLLSAYFAFLTGGGNADQFAGLPVYASYTAALGAYYDFLAGGGLPANYGALTSQQVADYLAALSAAGGFAAQLGQLSDFYTAYFAHISGGNNPATFSGLPIYADYVAALNAYYAFLAGGGLPGDYSALPLATLEAYLDALNAAGGFAAYGNLDGFFASYYAFVAGGGDPADFGGLPVYADYLDAVAAFYAFLANGGVPSAYTALTQEQVQAYLDALSGAGLLTANFQGNILAFFNNYLAYLAGGGVPDNFGGLPDGTAPQLAGINALVYGTDALRINSAADADIDDDGRITRVVLNSPAGNQTFDYTARTADLREHGRIGDDVAWSRYYVGNSPNATNTSEHLLVGTPAINMPTSGILSYQLVGGTAPTDRRGTPGSTAYFTGELGVAFGGGTPLVGVNFEVLSGTEGYHVETLGGAANPLAGGMGVDANGLFQNQNVAITDLTASTCNGFCQAQVFGSLFGDGATSAGFTYNIFDQSANNAIQGVAVFATSGTELAGLGTAPPPPPPPPPSTTLQNQQVAFANLFVGDDAVSGGNATINAQSQITAYQSRTQEIFNLGTASVAESGTSGSLYWTRWSNGVPGGNYYGTTSFNTLGANGGWHVIVGADLANMPVSGAVEYDITGFTTPTRSGEGSSTGSVTGGAAVVFGASPVFALDIDVTSASDRINLATDGGLVDPTQSRLTIAADGVFNSSGSNPQIITTNEAGSFCGSGCLSFVQGFLAGDGAADAGLSYAIRQEGVIPQGFINGTVAFAAGDPINLGNPDVGQGTVTNVFGSSPITNYVLAYPNTQFNFVENFHDVGLGNGNVGIYVDDQGQYVQSGINFSGQVSSSFKRKTAEVAEIYTVGGFQMGRWANGTVASPIIADLELSANQGLHYLVGPGVTSAFNFPGGTIGYELLAATAPTLASGSVAPGVFDASLVIDFSNAAVPKLGIEGTATFTGTGGFTYTFGSAGGIAAPSVNINLDPFVGVDGGRFLFNVPGTTDNGLTAQAFFFNSFGDAQGSSIGSSYRASLLDGSNNEVDMITGAAVFGSTGPVGGGGTGGGSGGGATTSDFTGTRDGIVYRTYTGASLASGFGGSADLVNGDLVNFTSILGTVSKGSASVVEAGDVGVLAWGRWTGGTVETRGLLGNVDTVIGANGGYHVIAGVASTSLPSSGTVNYDLIATTSPTDNLGSAPGTLTGELAIAFGSINKVGFNFQMDIGGFGYGVSTNGGAANPAASDSNIVLNSGVPTFAGTYNSIIPGSVAGTGGGCQTSCQVTIGGALYGSNGGYAGVAMNVFDAGNGVSASGQAIFQAQGTNFTYNPYASAPQGHTLAAVAPAAAAAPEWDRWEVDAGNISTGNGMAAVAPGLDALATSGVQYSPEQLAQLEAFYASRNPVN